MAFNIIISSNGIIVYGDCFKTLDVKDPLV